MVYKHIAKLWKRPRESVPITWKQRLIDWRKEGTVTRIERPTRIDRARRIGYKAKQGFVMVRVKVPKGTRKRPKPAGGRRPKRAGRFFSLGKSKRWVAEEKAARKFANLEVLNSYYVGEDGDTLWYEIIMVDPKNPSIIKDKDISWIGEHKGRAFRGMTSTGKKGRGLMKKGIGAEKVRPSLRAKKRRGK
ncbi:MAG: 50S ribosomal protein L15e [Candidatus Aenigmarchaeota archaeon]